MRGEAIQSEGQLPQLLSLQGAVGCESSLYAPLGLDEVAPTGEVIRPMTMRPENVDTKQISLASKVHG
jgi:hypothetical protein